MSEIIPYIDEDFTNGGVGSITTTFSYRFDSVYTGVFSIDTGTTTVYDFETDNEGFTNGGEGTSAQTCLRTDKIALTEMDTTYGACS